jgi:RNA polymerase sigma-70 factor (ECF subfamily)
MDYDEAAIIRNCQSGKSEAFGLIYDHYIRQIYNFIYYKTLHKETAEDLTSLTFMKALKSIGGFRTGQGTFSAWLYMIARNNVKDHYRTAKNDINMDDIYDLADDTDPLVDADNTVTLEKVRSYLAKLEPEQRELVTMRLWDGLAFKEIADALGLSEANSKMIFYRTMTKLREELALIIFCLLYTLISTI